MLTVISARVSSGVTAALPDASMASPASSKTATVSTAFPVVSNSADALLPSISTENILLPSLSVCSCDISSTASPTILPKESVPFTVMPLFSSEALLSLPVTLFCMESADAASAVTAPVPHTVNNDKQIVTVRIHAIVFFKDFIDTPPRDMINDNAFVLSAQIYC